MSAESEVYAELKRAIGCLNGWWGNLMIGCLWKVSRKKCERSCKNGIARHRHEFWCHCFYSGESSWRKTAKNDGTACPYYRIIALVERFYGG